MSSNHKHIKDRILSERLAELDRRIVNFWLENRDIRVEDILDHLKGSFEKNFSIMIRKIIDEK